MTIPAVSDASLGMVSAKLRAARPHRALVPRPRLVDTTRDRPIVVVVAEAGYGKSSFLLEWSRSAARRVWYTLDERDRDPTTFGQHLLTAIGVEAQHAQTWRARDERAADDLASRVLSLVERSADEVALVLDDYHSVADASIVDATVRRLLSDRPAQLRIALASRSALPVPLARLRARGLLSEIGPADLCFTRGELAVALADSELTESTLDTLHTLTGGWPAATQLLGDAWARRPHTVPLRGALSPQAFDAFLEQEVLPRLNASDVDLLARLSVLDEIDADSCRAVLNDPSGFEHVERLAEHFSCITSVEVESGRVYRIHRILRDFLLRRLPADDWLVSLTRAADFFEQHDRPIEAGQAAIALGDTERLAALIRKESARLIAQSRARTLAEWFEHLPDQAVEADPRLLGRRAQLEGELGHLARAQTLFERAARRLLEQGETPAAADVLRVQAGQLELAGAFAQARQVLTRVIELVDDDNSTLGIMLRNQLSVIRLRDGDAEGAVALAREVIERTAGVQDAKNQPLFLAVAHANLASILQTLGRFGEAQHNFLESIQLKRRYGFDGSLSHTLNNLGVMYQQQGRLAEAEPLLQEALDLAQRHGVAVVHAYALSNLGDVLRDTGDFDAAQAHYVRSLDEKARLGSDFGMAHTWNSIAAMWRTRGDLAQARDFNERALALRDAVAEPVERLLYRLERGRIALASGQSADACAELRETAAELARLGARQHSLEAAWWAGVARWRLDAGIDDCFRSIVDEYAPLAEGPGLAPLVAASADFALAAWTAGCGGDALTSALVQQHQQVVAELPSALVQQHQQVAPVPPSALTQDAEAPRRELIELLPRLPGNAPLQLLVDSQRSTQPRVRSLAHAELEALRHAPPAHLSVTGYGRLQVVRRGTAIADRAWRRQRSLELLGLLLLAGARGRPRDELIVECWPEATSDAGVEQFHTHLHALRSALEPEAARGTSRYVLADGRSYRLDFSLIHSWDAADLIEAVEAARAAEARDDLAAAEHAYGAASQLYRGSLFEGLTSEGEWLELAREEHRQRAIDARVRLGRVRERLGDPLGARDAWMSVLALDPLREDAHRGVMAVLSGMGQRDAALAHFRACADVVRRELGVDPSPETIALYRDIAG